MEVFGIMLMTWALKYSLLVILANSETLLHYEDIRLFPRIMLEVIMWWVIECEDIAADDGELKGSTG